MGQHFGVTLASPVQLVSALCQASDGKCGPQNGQPLFLLKIAAVGLCKCEAASLQSKEQVSRSVLPSHFVGSGSPRPPTCSNEDGEVALTASHRGRGGLILGHKRAHSGRPGFRLSVIIQSNTRAGDRSLP